jgi:hypothetical protein
LLVNVNDLDTRKRLRMYGLLAGVGMIGLAAGAPCERLILQGAPKNEPQSEFMSVYTVSPNKHDGMPVYYGAVLICGGSSTNPYGRCAMDTVSMYFNVKAKLWMVGIGEPVDGKAQLLCPAGTSSSPLDAAPPWYYADGKGGWEPSQHVRVDCSGDQTEVAPPPLLEGEVVGDPTGTGVGSPSPAGAAGAIDSTGRSAPVFSPKFFEHWDVNGDGYLLQVEMAQAFEDEGMFVEGIEQGQAQVAAFFRDYDKDGSGFVTKEEFSGAWQKDGQGRVAHMKEGATKAKEEAAPSWADSDSDSAGATPSAGGGGGTAAGTGGGQEERAEL